VLNSITAEREVPRGLVRHPGIDKVSFTGSNRRGKRIAWIARTGGPGSPRARRQVRALILDDYDIGAAAASWPSRPPTHRQ